MTQKIEDLIKSFSDLSISEQFEKIKNIRSARTIERPVAAVKRVKKEAKKKVETNNKMTKLFSGLTNEQKLELIKKLGGKTS